jgi:hypothetical protein
MKPFSLITIIALITVFAYADSGGPYEGVPDIKKNEDLPIFKIPPTKKELSFYLNNMPMLQWNKKHHEPESYNWKKIDGYYASFRLLGHVRGRRLFELRYVSDKRIAQAIDHADILIILAKGFDNDKDSNLLTPIYYTSGGVVYDHTAQYIPKAHKHGAIQVTRHYAGNGAHREDIYIRGTEDFGYERFSPQQKKDNNKGCCEG